MEDNNVERRHGRRVELHAPVLIRRGASSSPGEFTEFVSKNVGTRGVYCEGDGHESYAPNEVLVICVLIPPSQTHRFPFTRFVGHGRVVRVHPVAQHVSQAKPAMGVALAFSHDVTALTAMPGRV